MRESTTTRRVLDEDVWSKYSYVQLNTKQVALALALSLTTRSITHPEEAPKLFMEFPKTCLVCKHFSRDDVDDWCKHLKQSLSVFEANQLTDCDKFDIDVSAALDSLKCIDAG